MNRLKLSLAILVLLAILSVTGLMTIRHQCTLFTEQTQRIITAVRAGDMQEALDECDELYGLWEEFHEKTGIFVDGNQLDRIRSELVGLRALIAAEHPELLSRLEALCELTEELFSEELPDLWHIL
jgi:hypothetical protein